MSENYLCECENHLKNYVHICVVKNNKGKHFCNGTTWIGCSYGNQPDTILAHHLCPFDYCKAKSVGYDPDPLSVP